MSWGRSYGCATDLRGFHRVKVSETIFKNNTKLEKTLQRQIDWYQWKMTKKQLTAVFGKPYPLFIELTQL